MINDILNWITYNTHCNNITWYVCYRYLATGESFASLGYAFRISASYVSIVVRETLEALCEHLVPICLPAPTTESFKTRAAEFYEMCKFPNCCAAIDGKHIRILSPAKSGSLFWNYKCFFSIVLLAMVDANCKFVAVDVGSYGKEGDSGIFNKSAMGIQILEGNIFPPATQLPSSEVSLPFVIVGDEAFRLHRHILKPYSRSAAQIDRSKSLFNYRLSCARRVSENAFGLLCQVFRVFYTPIAVKPDTCDKLITACCCLHNLLRDAYLEQQGRPFFDVNSDVNLPQHITALQRSGGYSEREGFRVRDAFREYFSNE